ncbi:hypothetical protein [Streptomyces sp. NPDC006446]
MYVQVKVEGYDWSRYNGKQGQTAPLNHSSASRNRRLASVRLLGLSTPAR